MLTTIIITSPNRFVVTLQENPKNVSQTVATAVKNEIHRSRLFMNHRARLFQSFPLQTDGTDADQLSNNTHTHTHAHRNQRRFIDSQSPSPIRLNGKHTNLIPEPDGMVGGDTSWLHRVDPSVCVEFDAARSVQSIRGLVRPPRNHKHETWTGFGWLHE